MPRLRCPPSEVRCFCSPEEGEEIRKKQEAAKVRPGYYGVWAKCRNYTVEEMTEKIKNGESYIIRFKSPGREDKKIKHKDVIKGNVEFPENDQDIVIIKADGLPTYHFAHAIDDHLMGTTHVIRGDEWLSSVPLHLQLFYELGFKAPKFAHIAPIMKNDNGNKRKLSKRKDPEAAVSYYEEEGIPEEAVKEYLLNIANSNFENWRRANKDKDISEFELQLNKMGVSGALFDMVKLLDVAKTVPCNTTIPIIIIPNIFKLNFFISSSYFYFWYISFFEWTLLSLKFKEIKLCVAELYFNSNVCRISARSSFVKLQFSIKFSS